MATKQSPLGSLAALPLSMLDEDPYQSRISFDAPALKQLTESIRAEGVKVPLHVRRATRGVACVDDNARINSHNWQICRAGGMLVFS